MLSPSLEHLCRLSEKDTRLSYSEKPKGCPLSTNQRIIIILIIVIIIIIIVIIIIIIVIIIIIIVIIIIIIVCIIRYCCSLSVGLPGCILVSIIECV